MNEHTELRHGKSWLATAHALRLAMAGQTVLIMGTLTPAQVELVKQYVFGIDTGYKDCGVCVEVIDGKVTRIMPVPEPSPVIEVKECSEPNPDDRRKHNDVTGFYERHSRRRKY